MPKKKLRETTLDIELDTVHTREFYALIIIELVKHILFVENQIPILFDSMLQQDKDPQCLDSRGHHKHPKRHKFVQNAEKLFESIQPSLFPSSSSITVYILLGSSSTTPQIAYTLHLPPPATTSTCVTTPGAMRMHCLKFLRDFMGQSFLKFGDDENNTRKKLKLHVLFSFLSVNNDTLPHTIPQEDYSPRHNWSLRMLRGFHTTINVIPTSISTEEGKEQDLKKNDTSMIDIFKSTHVIKGLKSKKT